MKKHVLMLTTCAIILACNAIAVSAEERLPADQAAKEGGMMMHEGMMGHESCEGMMGHGMTGHRGMMGSVPMRIIFALMDSDGDGTISLQEFQAAHERIFKAMDANKDGLLTPEEMQAFMRGTSKSAPQQ